MAKNIKLSVAENDVYTKQYTTFRGVDFSKDASMVDDEHSPDAKNLISDKGGFPEKRPGWRTLNQLDGRINGIFSFGSNVDGCMVIHAGTKIYKLSGEELTLLKEGISDNRSIGKYFKGKLCILTGREYLVFDGEKCLNAKDAEDMYAPITIISRGVMALQYGDTSRDTTFRNWYDNQVYEDRNGDAVNYGVMPEGSGINLVSGKRKNHFEYKSGIVAFILDATISPGTYVTMRCLTTGDELFRIFYTGTSAQQSHYMSNGEECVINSEIMDVMMQDTAGVDRYHVILGNSEKNNCGYVICYPKTSDMAGYYHIEGIDNFSVEFTHEVEGYGERIDKCTVMDVFENRLFFSGNPDYPNADWYSGVNDPLYVPDLNYTEIGMDSSAIVGYLRTGDKQAILKSDGDDATIYMRSYSSLGDGSAIFPIKQGISGIGAIAKNAVCTFLDDPLYLTRNGVYAIAMQDISSERALNLRSTRINNRLLSEKELTDAVMCEWNGYLVLCVGECAYVADAAQKSYSGNKTGTFEYEWYYWTNIPATALHDDEGELYFGTEDGRICKFNTDLITDSGELEDEAYSDDGEAIVAEWATNLSDDGNFMQEKTLVKIGSGAMLRADRDSAVKVIVRTDRPSGQETTLCCGNKNISARYSVVPFNSRIKKYSAIQIVCRNDEINNAFGVAGIIRRYFYGKTKK